MGIPMSASDFEAAKKILDEGKNGNQPVTVRSLVSPVQPLSEMITGMDYGDETMRKELDFLGSRLRHMTRKGQDIFSVALKLETPGTLKEIINLSYNLDSYDLLEDISDPGRIAAELLRRGKQIEIPEVCLLYTSLLRIWCQPPIGGMRQFSSRLAGNPEPAWIFPVPGVC